jgi:A/G-specific adenine glycosylase
MIETSVYLRRKVIRTGRTLAKGINISQTCLPWREIRSPYRVFLAEMLLVRTRADVVARIYDGLFKQYPDIYKLANADENELGFALHPLGLTKRTQYIIKAACYIRDVHGGRIPSDIDSLLKIPGVGLYTASAISVFAYNQKSVPYDVNILRFLSRLMGLTMENKTKGSKELRDLVPEFSVEKTGLRTEVLLDFTRLICRPRNPLCNQCCLRRGCVYFRENRL